MNVKVRLIENVKILELAGSIDRNSASTLRQALIDATNGPTPLVVVNLQEVDFIDSSGFSALVLGLKRVREKQGNLCLCGLQPPVRMIFELTRFDKIFEIFNREDVAVLAAVGQI